MSLRRSTKERGSAPVHLRLLRLPGAPRVLEKRTLRLRPLCGVVMRVVFLRKAETKAHKRGTDLAGRWERRFYPPLRDALLTLQDRIQIAPIARAIVEANVEQVIAVARVDNVRDVVAAFAAELPGAVLAGGEQAARELGITHKAVIRKQVFDLGRPHIAAWLRDHAGELIVQVTDKSREAVRRVIEDGVLNGRHPTQMAKDVKKVVGLHRRQADAVLRRRKALEAAGVPAARVQEITDKYAERLLNQRARVIARNESLVAVNRGRYALWNQLVEDGALDATQEQRWDTAADEGVCEICAPMNGQRRKLNEPFTTGTGGIVDHPPAHVLCLPPGCVIGNAQAVAAMRRAYDGELVHIDTAFGPRLSVTPNHPILTRWGMVPAKLLQHGDDVLYAPSRDGVAPLVDPDGQALPSLVEEVFDSLGFSGSMKFAHVPSSPMQFHGDGSSNGHVDVVRADGPFCLARDAGRGELFHEADSIRRSVELPPRSACPRRLDFLLRGLFLACRRTMSCSNPSCTTIFRHLRPLEGLCLAAAAATNSGFRQGSENGGSGYVESLGKRLFGHALQIHGDHLVNGDVDTASLARHLISLYLLICPGMRPQPDGVSPRPLSDPPSSKAPVDGTPGEPQTITNLSNRKPVEVHGPNLFGLLSSHGFRPVPVSHVGVTSFRGLVHNIETAEGWYTAHGIVTSNCRCVVGLV